MTTATKKKPAAKPTKGPSKAEQAQAAAEKAQKAHDAELAGRADQLARIEALLEEAAADTGDGSVNDPAVIAANALSFFNAYKNHPEFQAILDAAAAV